MAIAAYGYLRVSSEGQLKGHGLDIQRRDIESYAKSAGVQIVRFYEDAHTGTEADRPAFMDMLGECMSNGVRTVVVQCMDRLARDLLVQSLLLAKLSSAGVTLISASTGEDITASMTEDPMRRALVQIQGVFAELDKSLLVRKLRKGRESARAKLGRCEGRKPFGSRPGEQAILDRIRALYRKPRGGERLTYQQIAARLNADNVPSRTGRPWSRGTVRKLLSRGALLLIKREG